MYPNYLEDEQAQMIDTCMRAIEGDQSHLRIQRGYVTLNLTAGSQLNQVVNFSPIFTPGTTPDVHLTLTAVGSITAKINVVAVNATGSQSNTQFTLQAYSDATQSITVNWLAIGKEE